MAEAQALGEDDWESRMDRLEATFATNAIRSAKTDMKLAEISEFMRSFLRKERCDVSGLIAKIDSIDAIGKMESIAMQDSTDSIPESDLNQEVEADSVSQLEVFEKEVSTFYLEPSLRVDQRQSMLLQNISSQLIVNGSGCASVWFAPKIEESFILDVELVVELIQKSVEFVDLVAPQLLDQLLLRVWSKMKQRKCQKDWTFKYKVKVFVKEKREQPRVKQEKLLISWKFNSQTKSVRQSTEISVTSLYTNEKKRFISLAGRFHKRAVEQDQVVNVVAEVVLRSWLHSLRNNIKAFWRDVVEIKLSYNGKVMCDFMGIESDLITLGFFCFMGEKFSTLQHKVWYVMMVKNIDQSFESVMMNHLRSKVPYWRLARLGLLEMLSLVAQVDVVLWFTTYQYKSVSGYIVELQNEEGFVLKNMWRASLVFGLWKSVSASMEFSGSVSDSENARYLHEVEDKNLQLNEKLEEKRCFQCHGRDCFARSGCLSSETDWPQEPQSQLFWVSVLVMENGSIDEAEDTLLVHKKCVSVRRRDVTEAAYMRFEKQWRQNSLIQKSFAIRSSLLQNRTQNVLWFLLVTEEVVVAFEFEMHHTKSWQQFYNIQRSVGVTTSIPFDPGGLLEYTTVSKEVEPLFVKRFTSFMLQLWTWKLLINLVVKVFQRGRICYRKSGGANSDTSARLS